MGFGVGDGGGSGATRGGGYDLLSLVLIVIGDVDIGCCVGGGVGGVYTGCFICGGPFMDSSSSSQAV